MNDDQIEPKIEAETDAAPVEPLTEGEQLDESKSEVSSKPILTQKRAEELLRDDIKNLQKKVENGRMLSASERAMLQAHADGEASASAKLWAGDQVELAEALGVTRKSVLRWRKEGAPPPQADGRWSVVAWREWVKANGKKGSEEDAGTQSKQQLECKRLLLMNEKLETELALLKGEYVKRDEVKKHIVNIIVECRKVLELGPASLAPQVAGRAIPDIERRLRAWIDEACEKLHTGTFQ